MAFIEYAMFKSEKREDRFEEIYRKIGEMECQRASDLVAIKSEWLNFKKEEERQMELHNFKLDKLDDFERNMKSFEGILQGTLERLN
jgi:hypothetical protein